MTKPAAVFIQIIGAILTFASFGFVIEPEGVSFGIGFWSLFLSGIALLVWAGRATRKRLAPPPQ